MRATYWMLAGIGLLTAVAIFVLATPGATAWYTGTQCPASGDWSVSSSTQYYDETLNVNGNIYVTSDLTLTNCVVRLNCNSEGAYTLNVANGASLTVYGSTITANNAAYHYRFTVYGSMWINQSTISEMWGNTGGWDGGIQLYSSNVWIGNSTIYNGKTGGIYISKVSPWIYNNDIYNNGGSSGSSTYVYGIAASGSSSTSMAIRNNRIYTNTYTSGSYRYGYGIRAEYLCTNDVIYGNNIYDNGHTNYNNYNRGYQVYLYYATPTMTDNQLTNGNYQLYCYYSNPPTINGGSISGFAYYYTTVYGVYAQYSGLSFANVTFRSTYMQYTQYGIYASSYSPINVTDCTFDYQQYGSYTNYAIYANSYSPVNVVRCNFYQNAYSTIYAIYANNRCAVTVIDSYFSNNYGYFYGIYGNSYCPITVNGSTMYSNNANSVYMIQANSYSPVSIEGSDLEAWYSYYDARLIYAYSYCPVTMNNTILWMYNCNMYQSAYEMYVIYAYSTSDVVMSNVTADFEYNTCYYWYMFRVEQSKLTINDTSIIDRYGNYYYYYYMLYTGYNSADLILNNVNIDYDAQPQYQWGGTYITQGYNYGSGAKCMLDHVTITGTSTGYFYGFYWGYGSFFMNNSVIDVQNSGDGFYFTQTWYGDFIVRNTKITAVSEMAQYGSILQGYTYDNIKKFIVDNCTIYFATRNTAGGSNSGVGIIQQLDNMDVDITNSTFTTENLDGVVSLQAFYAYRMWTFDVVDCTFHSIFGRGAGTGVTVQWGWFYESSKLNFTRCNITIDIEDEPMTLETFYFYYGCDELNLDQTNIYWNVDGAGSVVSVITFSDDSYSSSSLNSLSLKNSKLDMVVSAADCAVSLLKITPQTSIGQFKISGSVVNLEYLVPTSAPVSAVQITGSDITISGLRLNLKAPAAGLAELIGIKIESSSPTLNNITVMGNGNGRITGIMASLAATPTLNGCLVDNCYIGIGGDFFGMPYVTKSSTVNCTIGVGLQNLCNATVVDSVIKGKIAVQLMESSRVNMFTSTIQGSVLDWELNGTSTAWLLDCNFKPATSQNFLDDGSRLIVNWYLSMWVTWQNNREIPGADVVMRNAQNEEFMRGTTDIQGVVAPFIAVEYLQTKNAKTMFSPYVVNVTSGGVSGEQSVTTDKSKVGLLREHIIIRDDLLPEVAILEPQVGVIQNFVTVTMLGTASDVGSGVDYLMVSYDGTNWVKVDAASVWMEVLQVPEGTWTLTAKAFDKSGNEASATRQIVIDLTRPFITVTSPPDKSLGNVIGVDLAGSVEPGSTLMVNFRPATVSAEGAFTYPVRLVEGRNDFVLFARDRAGNENTTSWTLYLDITPPPLTVFQPKDGLLTNQSAVMVTGKTEAGAAVTVNGVPAVVGADGAFSAQLGLTVGPNFITVVASDAAGNKNTVLRSVVMDNEVRLDISAPADKLVTTQVTILVMGSTDTDALVRLNGAVVSIESDGNFSVTFTLNEGWNTLVFAASDRAGNFRSVARTVLLDTIAPLVEVGTPQAGAMLQTGNVAVSGICEAGITLTVNGQPADTAAGVFNATVTLPEGANRIVVEGRDAAGNKYSIEVPITVDLTNPSLKIIEPSVGFRTVERSVLVVGLTEPGAKVTVNDMPAVVDAFGKFTVQLTLARGANQVTATSTDAAGNTATEKMTVKVVDRVASTGVGDWWWTALGLLLALGIMIPLTMYLINSWQRARIEKGGSK